MRHHAFRADCSTTEHWGKDAYEISTNSLGFRDERIRQVPLSDARPRLLMLGDSFTEGMSSWGDSYVGKIAAHFPQYDFLNGGVGSYSPSNYLNVVRMLLTRGVEFDEVIVFIDISDVQDEAYYYQDIDESGAVTRAESNDRPSWYSNFRFRITRRFLLTNYVFESLERRLVEFGCYHLSAGPAGDVFDLERSAWTYRKASEADYRPLGVEGGIAKEKAKMTVLWQEAEKRHIPISVVVYPWPAQLAHDTADSWQVRIWRDWCAGKCKDFISLFPAFFAVKNQCPRTEPGCWYQRLFIFGDYHYNSAGTSLVADAVAKTLDQMPPTKHRQLRVESKHG